VWSWNPNKKEWSWTHETEIFINPDETKEFDVVTNEHQGLLLKGHARGIMYMFSAHPIPLPVTNFHLLPFM
jgi:hypothetical protein